MAGAYNFSVFAGETFDRTLTWSQSNIPVSQGGTPVDLTGYDAFMSVGNLSAYVTTTSTANGQITLGGAEGTIRVYMPDSALLRFSSPATAVQYRLFVVAPSDEPRVLLAGNFKVKP